MSSAPAVELRGLQKRYGHVRAVGPLELTVERGEFFSLLGPSGCGKTTTLRLIAGLEVPTAGEIVLNGRDVTRVPTHHRGIGLVFQSYALFPHRTVLENVAFGLRVRRVDSAAIRRRVERALGLVGLGGLEGRYPAQLSGGQQQRVAVARAVVYEPELLLFDEPLSNLDAKLREQMRSELRNLTRSLGITAVYVTHDQTEALALSDRLAVLDRGVIAQFGTPTDVYERPRSAFVADFIGSANLLRAEVTGSGDALTANTTHGLKLELPRTHGAEAGGSALVLIRPERIRVHAASDSPAGPNAMLGEVEEVTYMGGTARYALRIGDLHLTALTDRVLAGSSRGQSVWLSVAPDDIVLVPEGSGGGR